MKNPDGPSEPMQFVVYCHSDTAVAVVEEVNIMVSDVTDVKVEDEVMVDFPGCAELEPCTVKAFSHDKKEMLKFRDELNKILKPKRNPSFHEGVPRKAKVKCLEKYSSHKRREVSSKSTSSSSKNLDSNPAKQKRLNAGDSSPEGASATGVSTQEILPSNSKDLTAEPTDSSGSSSDSDISPEMFAAIEKLQKKGKLKDLSRIKSFSSRRTQQQQSFYVPSKRMGDVTVAAVLTPRSPHDNQSDNGSVEKTDEEDGQEYYDEMEEGGEKDDKIKEGGKDLKKKDGGKKNVEEEEDGEEKDLKKKDGGKKNVEEEDGEEKDLKKKDGGKKKVEEEDGEEKDRKKKDSADKSDNKSQDDKNLKRDRDGKNGCKKDKDDKNEDSDRNRGNGDVKDHSSSSDEEKVSRKKKKTSRKVVKISFDGQQYKYPACEGYKDSDKVVEVHPKSNVFISAKGLRAAKKANTPNAMARVLTRKIFRKDARAMCSVSGKPSYRAGVDTMEVRTALKSSGIEAIIDCVKARCLKKRWTSPSDVSLKQSIGNMLSDERLSRALQHDSSDSECDSKKKGEMGAPCEQ